MNFLETVSRSFPLVHSRKPSCFARRGLIWSTVLLILNLQSITVQVSSWGNGNATADTKFAHNSSGISLFSITSPIERTISSGESHPYDLKLSAESSIRIWIRCWNVELNGILYDSTGQNRAQFICRKDTVTPFSIIGVQFTPYRLEIRPLEHTLSVGGYEMRAERIADVKRDSQSSTHADAAFSEAESLRGLWKAESNYRAIKKYKEAQEYWGHEKDPHAEAIALRRIGETYQSLDDYKQATAYYAQALKLAQRVNDFRTQSDILNDAAYLSFHVGSNEDALRKAEQALKLSEVVDYHQGEAQALYNMGEAHYGLGDLPATLDYFNRAMRIWRQLNDSQGQAKTLVTFGYSYIELSDVAKAAESYHQALSIALRQVIAAVKRLPLERLVIFKQSSARASKPLIHSHKRLRY